ncbi:MAG: hypothetical protein JKX98_01260 [Alcanivoracaceae bacterium]|nr:hypothetical protein [Alcanivoracaceae bacterium]
MEPNRWHKLMKAFNLANNVSTYDSLLKVYSEKHRHYHTFQHIDACLSHLDKSKNFAQNSQEIEVALWFHDAIYKPYSPNNELKSAIWAKKFLLENKIDKTIADRVYDLIMVTLHNCPTTTIDEVLLVDIDLTILGSQPEVYQVFENNIRKEYRWIPYFYYRKKRKEILQFFLTHARIYQTEYFYNLLEKQARENIQRTLMDL